MIRIMRLHDDAILPTRGSEHAAGWDLYAQVPCELKPYSRATISTGVCIAVPEGYVGLVCPRSGLASKYGVTVTNGPGVCDADFRGPVMVCLANLDSRPYQVGKGDRIAQLVVVPYLSEAVEVDSMETTLRGSGGMGSTGR